MTPVTFSSRPTLPMYAALSNMLGTYLTLAHYHSSQNLNSTLITSILCGWPPQLSPNTEFYSSLKLADLSGCA